jgi:hypothetical protein
MKSTIGIRCFAVSAIFVLLVLASARSAWAVDPRQVGEQEMKLMRRQIEKEA